MKSLISTPDVQSRQSQAYRYAKLSFLLIFVLSMILGGLFVVMKRNIPSVVAWAVEVMSMFTILKVGLISATRKGIFGTNAQKDSDVSPFVFERVLALGLMISSLGFVYLAMFEAKQPMPILSLWTAAAMLLSLSFALFIDAIRWASFDVLGESNRSLLAKYRLRIALPVYSCFMPILLGLVLFLQNDQAWPLLILSVLGVFIAGILYVRTRSSRSTT